MVKACVELIACASANSVANLCQKNLGQAAKFIAALIPFSAIVGQDETPINLSAKKICGTLYWLP